MKKPNRKRIVLFALCSAIVIVLGVAGWIWFLPHRDIRSAAVDEEVDVATLTRSFANDPSAANAHYLSGDGNSKVLQVSGPVFSISTNNQGEAVVLIKADTAKMGVIATFLKDYSKEVQQLKKGTMIKVKGAITSGNSFDADLGLVEHATLIKCVLLQ